MRLFVFVLLFTLTCSFSAWAQKNPGILAGTVINDRSEALAGATVQLIPFRDSGSLIRQTDGNGAFQFNNIALGYYRLRISYSGLPVKLIDSIHFRAERSDFQMNDLVLRPVDSTGRMEDIVIYAEKPLIQSKDGNITFNAGESALSAGSNASDLLQNVPLVNKDPGGKLLVRGKEPRILIDDKPVELNAQQLQDLLESMPGSSIEKVEVMTNPPAQYGNETGVINIVTKKGSIGKSGRISIYGGSRGEAGVNGSYNYRKKGLTINVNTGLGYNRFTGNGYSRRINGDSSALHTTNQYTNRNLRPNLRFNMSYDLNKNQSLSLTLMVNGNGINNRNSTEYRNLNKFQSITRLTTRDIAVQGNTWNPNLQASYVWRSKKAGESFSLHTGLNHSSSDLDRDFYQRFYNPDYTFNGVDSTQQQLTDNGTLGSNVRVDYNLPLGNKKTSLSTGGHFNWSRSNVLADASYFRKSDGTWAAQDLLSNDFRFRQSIANVRTSMKHVFSPQFSATLGLNAERTSIRFDFRDRPGDTANGYWTFLPFATVARNWKDVLNLTASYRRTLRRPGIGELNPTIDYSDPYNLRFGNPGLLASPSHNFDVVLGRTKNSFYTNLGLGYNIVEDIYAQVRTLLPDGKTQVTYQNISGRKEYEVSTWSGLTLTKQLRVNLSASYTYNQYSAFDKQVRKYRDGGSFTSNLNGNFTWKDIYTATGNFTLNRFANPQGTVRSTLSMNLGLQARFFKRKMSATLNLIDPLVKQENRSITYGPNFMVENYSTTRTRNFRLTLGYNFSNAGKKKTPAQMLGKPKNKV